MPLGYAGLTWSSNLGKSGIGSSGLSGSPTFGLTDIQHDPMTVGIYQPQIWGGSDQLVRRNLLLNTATLATQNVTVLGLSYTLYIKGTGSVTLSGAATGTLNGTGASNRVSLQFTATAGTLTLTVSGSVTEGHLTRTATTNHSYQAVTDWTTEVFQYNAQRQLPWLRYNILYNTSDFSQLWTLTRMLPFGSGSSHASHIDPTGAMGADIIIEDNTASNSHAINSNHTLNLADNATLTFSVSCAPHGRNWVYLTARTKANSFPYQYFNILNGTLGSSNTPGNARITPENNGFYRCEFSVNFSSGGATPSIYVFLANDTPNYSYSGDGLSGVAIFGPQIAYAQNSKYQQINSSWSSTYTALAQAAGYPISLYSDRAGTIAVDSPETVVGKMLDLSTKGNHLVAPTDAARPLLKRDGNGNYYLLCELSNNSLNVSFPDYGTSCEEATNIGGDVANATKIHVSGSTSFVSPKLNYGRVLTSGTPKNKQKLLNFVAKLSLNDVWKSITMYGDSQTYFTRPYLTITNGVVGSAAAGGETITQILSVLTGDKNNYNIATFWGGHNGSDTLDPISTLNEIKTALGTRRNDRILFCSCLTSPQAGYYNPGTIYDKIKAFNAALQYEFANNYIDVLSFLQSHFDVNNSQDVIDIQNDIVPSTLRNTDNSVHLNSAGYQLVADFIKDSMIQRGWIT